MEELIKKGALSEEIESLTVHVTGLRAGKGVLSKFMTEYRKSVLRVIDEQPTTTEAEIRAKAISDTIEAVKEHTRIVGSTTCEDLDEIAEELKGGAD